MSGQDGDARGRGHAGRQGRDVREGRDLREGRETEVGEQDLLALLDELEGFLAESGRIPLTGRLLVNEQEAFELIDRLRQCIPEALHQAQKLTRERERLMSQAREEGEHLINESRAYAEKLTRESVIVQRAQELADHMLDDARRMGREMRLAARDYVDDTMEHLESTVQSLLSEVRHGREQLGTLQAAAAADDGEARHGSDPGEPPVRESAPRERGRDGGGRTGR